MNIETIKEETKQGLNELLAEANLSQGDILVVGLSTSEVQGKMIGKFPSIEISRAIIKTILDIIKPLGIQLAVQGCQHLNRDW